MKYIIKKFLSSNNDNNNNFKSGNGIIRLDNNNYEEYFNLRLKFLNEEIISTNKDVLSLFVEKKAY